MSRGTFVDTRYWVNINTSPAACTPLERWLQVAWDAPDRGAYERAAMAVMKTRFGVTADADFHQRACEHLDALIEEAHYHLLRRLYEARDRAIRAANAADSLLVGVSPLLVLGSLVSRLGDDADASAPNLPTQRWLRDLVRDLDQEMARCHGK